MAKQFRRPPQKPVESMSDEKIKEIISSAKDSPPPPLARQPTEQPDTDNTESEAVYKRMTVKFTKKEYDLLFVAAKADRRPMQHFIREAVVDKAKQVLKNKK